MKKNKNMTNMDLYETPCLWAEIEVFTNRAQEKLKKQDKTRVRKSDLLEVLDRLWGKKRLNK